MVEWREVIDTTDWDAGVDRMYIEAMTHALTNCWISDRLPEYTGKTQFVLCSVGGEVPYVVEANYGRMGWGEYDEEPVFWRWDGLERNVIDNVTAWMPCPEPYSGRGMLDELCE